MALLDIFDTDAFSVHALTVAVDKLPYVPSRMSKLGLFESKPITTPTAIVESREGVLALLPTMPRGSEQQTTMPGARRKVKSFVVPHIPVWDAVLAQDLEGKRAFGSEDQTEAFSAIVNDKLEAMKQSLELTYEYHRIGAIHGIVLDADGTTEIVDWFTEFGVTELEVAFDFADTGDYDNADPAIDVKVKAQIVRRMMQDALGLTPFKGIHALCGDQFFDSIVSHATVRRAYERYQENGFSRELQSNEGGFEFAGIVWENYRGTVGGVDFVQSDECRFFPTGTKGIFIEANAPGDFVETVNTRGKPWYAKQERMKWDKGIELHVQGNTLFICTRPRCLIKGVGTNITVPLS